MRILCCINNIPHSRSLQVLAAELRSRRHDAMVDVVIQDQYSNVKLRHLLHGFTGRILDLPRDGHGGKIWNDPFVITDNFILIRRFLEQTIYAGAYDLVYMIQYDRGSLEIMILDRCRQAGIPTLLSQEGLVIHDSGQDETTPLRAKTAVPSMASRLRKWWSLLFGGHSIAGYFAARSYFQKHPSGMFGFNGADMVATLSEHYSDLLRKSGFPASKLFAVGLPRFDEINRKLASVEHYGWPEFRQGEVVRLLFPQQWGFQFGIQTHKAHEELALIGRLLSALKGKGLAMQVIYRLRQGEKMDDYRGFEKEHPGIIFQEGIAVEAYDAIMQCDILLSSTSTMLIEAMKLKRYCIVYASPDEDYYGYIREGRCRCAADLGTLTDVIEEIVTDAECRKEMRAGASTFTQQRAMMDGAAGRRTADLIERIIGVPD